MERDGRGGGVFAPGTSVVRRDVAHGRVWSATPYRVLRDTGDALLLACWPGATMLAPAPWLSWLEGAGEGARSDVVAGLASGRWSLVPWVWRDRAVLAWFWAGERFSVRRFFDAAGRGGDWQVDLACPYVRTAVGIDTLDLLVDLVVAPDLSTWAWKDEDQYEQARRLGLVDDRLDDAVARARRRVVGLLEARWGPFGEDWSVFRPDAAWPVPALPAGAVEVPLPPGAGAPMALSTGPAPRGGAPRSSC